MNAYKGYNIPVFTFEEERKKAIERAIVFAEKEEGDEKMILSVLTLDREWNELWIDKRGRHEAVIHNVTGVEWTGRCSREVKLLYKGEHRGLIWNVHEIKEEW